MTTIDERLREALDGYCPTQNYPENFRLELAARGLAIVEIGEPASAGTPSTAETLAKTAKTAPQPAGSVQTKSTDQHTNWREARGILKGCQTEAEYVSGLEAALRTALTALEAADGAWATDEPFFRTYDAEMWGGKQYMRAEHETYHRQDFSAAIAKVKEVLGE